jgi:hypothetical protein
VEKVGLLSRAKLNTDKGSWQNVKIEAGKEFFSSYTMSRADDTKDFVQQVDVYVYRRAKPPVFTTFRGSFPSHLRSEYFIVSLNDIAGKKTLQPGFELICKVQADLEKPFRAAKVLTSSTGKLYRDVLVSLQGGSYHET